MMQKFKLFSLFGLLLLGGFVSTYVMGSSRNLEGITIVTRDQRGADDSARLTSLSKEERVAQSAKIHQEEMDKLKINNPTLYQKKLQEQAQKDKEAKLAQEKTDIITKYFTSSYPLDRYPDWVEKKVGNLWLIREDMFSNIKNKIIVHHTAMPYKTDWTPMDVSEHLKLIYQDHIVKYGDMAYHFLIDPEGLIYEGKSGGPLVAGTHVSYNNIRSIGISLLGNFEIQPVTAKQRQSLIALLTSLSKYYGIDPYEKVTYQRQIVVPPYLRAHQDYAISTHKDTAATACPGKDLYEQFESIRAQVASNLKQGIISAETIVFSPSGAVRFMSNAQSKVRKLLPYFEGEIPKLTTLLDTKKSKYPDWSPSNKSLKKVSDSIGLEALKKAMVGEITVLLYELSTDFDEYLLSCPGKCKISINGRIHDAQKITIRKMAKTFLVTLDEGNTIETNNMILRGNQNLVVVENFARKSFLGIPWNSFRGELIFDMGTYPQKDGNFDQGLLVLNRLAFQDYLKGIVETNDQESLTKNKIMALLAKGYALFYSAGNNVHPNIPKNAVYQAIDDPDFFQKYVGAGAESTLKKWPLALEATKNQIVLYEKALPILPYFNCSAGFTISGKEKRGWEDTPYLKSMLDFGPCKEFNGHGVGLAGQGAEVLSQYGWGYDEIIEYYYPGVGVYDL